MAALELAQALGIDPAAIMIAGCRNDDGNFEILVMIVPDETTPDEVISEAERILKNG
jgi:hypothetical protein